MHIPAVMASGLRVSLFEDPRAWFAARTAVYATVAAAGMLAFLASTGIYALFQPEAPRVVPLPEPTPVHDNRPVAPTSQEPLIAFEEINRRRAEVESFRTAPHYGPALQSIRAEVIAEARRVPGFVGSPIYGPSGRKLGDVMDLVRRADSSPDFYVVIRMSDGAIASAPAKSVMLETRTGGATKIESALSLVPRNVAGDTPAIARVEFAGAFYQLDLLGVPPPPPTPLAAPAQR
jgi:hypothetical protein